MGNNNNIFFHLRSISLIIISKPSSADIGFIFNSLSILAVEKQVFGGLGAKRLKKLLLTGKMYFLSKWNLSATFSAKSNLEMQPLPAILKVSFFLFNPTTFKTASMAWPTYK